MTTTQKPTDTAALPAAPATTNIKPTHQGNGRRRKPFQGPKNKLENRLLQPNNLATKQTQLTKNDPLWLESFDLDGETGLANTKAAKEFEADAAGYVELVEEEYKAISDVDKHYSKSVPASAHAYYHHVLYWYKIALLAQKHGTSTASQDRLVQFVQGYPLAMAGEGAATYLAGLGDYEDETGVRHVLVAQTPNDQGHFGRATTQTHSLYEHLPAPTISLQRTLEDVAKTTVRDYDEHWMVNDVSPVASTVPFSPSVMSDLAVHDRRIARIDAEFRDREADLDANESGEVQDSVEGAQTPQRPRPTVNLLGWRPAKILSAKQLAEMRAIYDDEQRNVPDVSRVNNTYALYRPLFEFVEQRIRECKRYKTSVIPTNTTGSLAQQTVWIPDSTTASATQAFISLQGQLRSRTMLPLRIVVAGKVMCYRAIRREFEEEEVITNPWACFHYGGYRNVPQNWRNNRNVLAQRARDGLIDYTPFATAISSRHDTLIEYLNKHKQST